MNKIITSALILPVIILIQSYSAICQEILEWKDCIRIAREKNPDLISAREKIHQLKASQGISRSSLLPQFDATADISKSKTDSDNIPASNQTSESYSYGITGKQLLFDSAKNIYDMKASGKKLEAMNYNYKVVSATIRQNLRYAFVQLLSTQEKLKIVRDILTIRENNYNLVSIRYKAGLEHSGSLYTAEANLAQARSEISQAERAIILARRNLAKNMGLEEFISYKAMGKFEIPAVYEQKPDIDMLARSNPELKEIIQERMAAELNLRAANLDYSPRIYGVVSAGRSDNKWPPETAQYSAGIQMSFNIFQGGKSHYQVSQARAELKQMFADERSTLNTVLYYLEEAWTNLQDNIESVKVQEKFLTAAEERARIADAQYSIGTILFDNWNTIQDALVSAKKNYLNAATNALLSEADWIQAQGGTLNYD